MALTVEFEKRSVGVVLSAAGRVSDEEISLITRYLYVPEIMARLRYQIVDLSEANCLAQSALCEWLEHCSSMHDELASTGARAPLKTAVVATLKTNRGDTWLAALNESDTGNTAVFPNLVQARAWLDRQVEQAH